MMVNRLNPVQKARYLEKKKIEKWEQMKNVQ